MAVQRADDAELDGDIMQAVLWEVVVLAVHELQHTTPNVGELAN